MGVFVNWLLVGRRIRWLTVDWWAFLWIDWFKFQIIFFFILKIREGEDKYLNPDDIADSYYHLASQSKSTWTFEVDLRPFQEQW